MLWSALKRAIKYLLRPLFPILGNPYLWRDVRHEPEKTVSPAEGIQLVQRRFDVAEPSGDCEPVFVLAPTWRCGSTLVQRLILSGDDIWMWGEVYTRCDPAEHLSAVFRSTHEGYPFIDMFVDGESRSALEGSWIANLSPKPERLLAAHRAHWDALLGQPARARGYPRWGMKEVNLTAEHAAYFRALYPDAKVVFLVRNPFSAWLSYYRWRNWYASYPDEPVVTVGHFGRLWRQRTQGFLDATERLNALLVRYEDLVDDSEAIRRLGTHVSTSIDVSVLESKVRQPSQEAEVPKRRRTRWLERKVLERAVTPTARRLGYESI